MLRVFEQVGSIINEYVPEFYRSDLFPPDSIVAIHNSPMVDFDKWKNIQSVKLYDSNGRFESYTRPVSCEWIEIFLSKLIKNNKQHALKSLFARKIDNLIALKKFTHLTKISIVKRTSSLSFLENMYNLEYLHVKCDDLEKIKHLTSLKHLNTSSYSGDISALEELINLRELAIKNTHSLEPLKNHTNLIVFVAREYKGSIDDLKHNKNLYTLYVDEIYVSETTFEKLKKLRMPTLTKGCLKMFPNLSNLKIMKFNGNLNDITCLRDLQTLILPKFTGDLSPLCNHSNLTELYIKEYKLGDKDGYPSKGVLIFDLCKSLASMTVGGIWHQRPTRCR